MSTKEFTITERPISGELTTSGTNTTEQITKEEFLAKLDAILALPHVTAVKWEQYTPYFNDGEACTFGVGEVRLKFDLPESENEDDDRGEYDDDSYSTYELYDGTINYVGEYGVDRRPDLENSPEATFSLRGIDTREHFRALYEFGNSSDSWERVALLSFGDHAEVVATKDGFSVEYYEHE